MSSNVHNVQSEKSTQIHPRRVGMHCTSPQAKKSRNFGVQKWVHQRKGVESCCGSNKKFWTVFQSPTPVFSPLGGWVTFVTILAAKLVFEMDQFVCESPDTRQDCEKPSHLSENCCRFSAKHVFLFDKLPSSLPMQFNFSGGDLLTTPFQVHGKTQVLNLLGGGEL